MTSLTREILNSMPKWLFVVAFCVFVIFILVSPFFGTFKLAGYEFGYTGPDEKTNEQSIESYYIVKGLVVKNDSSNPVDVLIIPRYPPLKPTGNGAIYELEVWKDPNGKFPTLAFCLDGFSTEAVDLNDPDEVRMEKDNIIRIKDNVILKKIN